MAQYDVVVVGAGIVGLSTAYYIKKENPNAQVLVVDKFNAAGQGSTAKSASAFRCLFSSHTNFILTDSSVEFYRHLQDDLKVDLGLKWTGYLWLLNENIYREMLVILKSLAGKSFEYRVYDADELAQKLHMRTDLRDDEEAQLMGLGSVYKGVLIPKAGVVDADSIVSFYEKEFLRFGGKIQYGLSLIHI